MARSFWQAGGEELDIFVHRGQMKTPGVVLGGDGYREAGGHALCHFTRAALAKPTRIRRWLGFRLGTMRTLRAGVPPIRNGSGDLGTPTIAEGVRHSHQECPNDDRDCHFALHVLDPNWHCVLYGATTQKSTSTSSRKFFPARESRSSSVRSRGTGNNLPEEVLASLRKHTTSGGGRDALPPLFRHNLVGWPFHAV